MREIGKLVDGNAARRLADYLLTLKIETQLDQQPDGWIVWVCDEDRVPQARDAFTEFERNPGDSRFTVATRTAQELRLREIEEDEDYRQRLTEFRERMSEPQPQLPYATVFLIATAGVVTFLTNFGEPLDSPVLRYLWIATGTHLADIAHGQLWRLVTPIFIHFDPMHLLFNCYVVFILGGAIERRQGSPRLIWLVFVTAVASNLAQFYLGHPSISQQHELVWLRSPYFGGLSGVGYALFGYLWMKSLLEPELGFHLQTWTVFIMIAWFFACLVDLIPHVANGAHAAGLLIGIVIGAGPWVWRQLRQR
jgi:GlpG protein